MEQHSSNNKFRTLQQQQIDKCLLNMQQRQELNTYFSMWIEYYKQRKLKWNDLIKYKYLIQKVKLNKMFWAWKLQIRQIKLVKLKQSLIQHSVYKQQIRSVFYQWKQHIKHMKFALSKVEKICLKRIKKVVITYLKYRSKDQNIKEEQVMVAQAFKEYKLINKVIKNLLINKYQMKQKKRQNQEVIQMQKMLTMRKCFRGIVKYGKLVNRKELFKQNLGNYLQNKHKSRGLKAFKENLLQCQMKDINIRKAMQFQVFRYKYYIQKQAFRIVKQFKQNKTQNQHQIIINNFIMRKYLQKIKNYQQMQINHKLENVRKFRSLKLKTYCFNKWNEYRHNKKDKNEKLNKAIMFNKWKYLDKSINGFKSYNLLRQQQNQSLQQVIDKQLIKIKQLLFNQLAKQLNNQQRREQLLSKCLNQRQNNLIRNSFKKVLKFTRQKHNEVIVKQFRSNQLKQRHFNQLKEYLKQQQKKQINEKKERKFKNLQLLKKGLNMFKRVITQKQIKLNKIELAKKFNDRNIKLNCWKQFMKLDELVKVKKKYQLKVKQRIFILLNQNKQIKCENKNNKAIAQIRYQNSLVKKYFKQFKQITKSIIKIKQHNRLKQNQVKLNHQKSLKHKVIIALSQYRQFNLKKQAKVKYAQEKINQVKLRWILNSMQEYGYRKQQSREKQAMAYIFNQRRNEMKIIKLLRQNVKQMKMKKRKIYKCLKFWSVRAKRKCLIGLLSYCQYKQECREAYEYATNERQKKQVQQTLFKMIKVGEYWQNQSKVPHQDFEELQMQQAFTKWKYSCEVFQNQKVNIINPLLQKKETKYESCQQFSLRKEKSLIKQVTSQRVTKDQKEVLEWLSNIDQKQSQVVDFKSNTLNTYLSKKKEELETKHKSRLQEFDHFLSQVSTKKPALNLQQQSFKDKLFQQEKEEEIKSMQAYELQENNKLYMDTSITPIKLLNDLNTPQKSQNINKIDYSHRVNQIQSEIQQFLQEKQILKTLEKSDCKSQAVKLMREEIISKSEVIKKLCDELKQIKQIQK